MVEASLSNIGFQGDDSTRYSSANGYSAGALVDLLGTSNLVLETGVLYRQLGTTYKNGLGDNRFTANYISVPISAKYYFSGQEVTSLYLKAGVMGSTLISDNTVYATPTTRIGARSWETAFLAGVGVKVNLSDVSDLIVEGDYSRSIESVFNNASIYRSDLSAALGFAVNL
jgi:opacity protein-like surface antigen